jgi:serine/threonine protein kinase
LTGAGGHGTLSDQVSLIAGQALGNYRILSRVGVGGMGMVFLAEHPHIGKKVALKVIHRELAGNKEVVSRFLNEARAVNQIGNEHIVEIHDFGQTDNGEHFFIMEYLEGRTLAMELARSERGIAVPRALHVGAQIASALAAAHAQAIIHRDLKPDNVMLIERLGDRDFVKLLDFGLAKFLADGDSRKLTAAGVVLGTPQYMSPEACESRPGLDHRSDIYSLGILLFQMLTGIVPFGGDSMGEVLVKQVAQPPPAPRGINPDIPPAVEQVLLRCLAKDPNARFQDMAQLRDALLDPNQYLASAPPIVAAATPDARTVFAARRSQLVNAQHSMPPQQQQAPYQQQPLPQPPAGADAQKTMMAADGMAAPSAPPEMPAAPPDLTGRRRVSAGSDAPTAYMDQGQAMFGGHMQRMVPAPVENRTMAIAPPAGYKEHPPRRWPVILVVAALVTGAGVVTVIALQQEGAEAKETPALPARAPAPPVADDKPTVAHVTLTSRPSGASVYDQTGKFLATTPAVVEMPIGGDEVTLIFRHPDAREREKKLVPSGDAKVDVELLPVAADLSQPGAGPDAGSQAEPPPPPPEPDPPKKKKKRKKKSSDGLLAPTF